MQQAAAPCPMSLGGIATPQAGWRLQSSGKLPNHTAGLIMERKRIMQGRCVRPLAPAAV